MLERAKAIAELTIPNCVAIGTAVLCGYLYLTGQPVPGELATAAAAANAYIFKRTGS